jgi:hypothetical protein
MALAAIAENDCLQQRGPIEPVDVIDIDTRLDQGADGFNMTALRRWNESGAAIAIGACS